MLRKSKAIFPTKKQKLKNLLIDNITDDSNTIVDFFHIIGDYSDNISFNEKHKVINKVISDNDLWEMLNNKIEKHLKLVVDTETDALILMGSPTFSEKSKDLIRPFVLDFLENSKPSLDAIESLRKLREVLENE